MLCLIVATPLAYTLARKSGRYKTTLLVLLLVPFWTSFLIRTLSWQILLAPGGHVQAILNGELCQPDDRIMILAPIVRGRKGAYRKEFEKLAQDGYVRVRINGEPRWPALVHSRRGL